MSEATPTPSTESRLTIGTLVTLVDARDPQRHERAGMIMGYSGNALYQCALFADGQQKEANPVSIIQNVKVDDRTPTVGNERWRILTATGTGDLAGTMGNLIAAHEDLKRQFAEFKKEQANQLADISAKHLAAIRTIAESVSPDFARVVDKAITTGVVQRLNAESQPPVRPPARAVAPKAEKKELVGAGA